MTKSFFRSLSSAFKKARKPIDTLIRKNKKRVMKTFKSVKQSLSVFTGKTRRNKRR